MAIRFIVDSKLREERETVAEILSLVQRSAYPDKQDIHLARFMDACFMVIENDKRDMLRREQEEKERQRQAILERARQEREAAEIAALEAQAPVPEAPLPDAPSPGLPLLGEEEELAPPSKPAQGARKEYVVRLYGAPVGVMVDKNEQGRYSYHVVEPQVDPQLIEKARSLFQKDLEKDNSRFDDPNFMSKVMEKATKKLGMQANPILIPNLRYFLERDILGAGKFDIFLYDENVQSITCDGAQKPIKVEYTELGSIDSNVSIESNEDLNLLIQRIATATGNTVDQNNPSLNITFQGLRFEGLMGLGGQHSRLNIRRVAA